MLKVGQKVICIDGSPVVTPPGMAMLRVIEGEVYTIRSIHMEPHIQGYGVRLKELLNSSILWTDGTECEWAYKPERFRPVVETETELRESATVE